ncbi:XdhC family protein [Alteriqipengyuania lutimaris]|uniref:XdhC family protein n=1 Tax=Alteriqipengyuania lutimaris TaxID=1538146 RepID=A0A395LRV2_9SPHN|nr:XdhC family protein [Alteriqipengyuania lutimaris]MBB3033694.1 xanthine dehydrogenase accessory factor [Alteriqipengyuania lutimaris]RDS77320.1 XdhC family protein [Alteriqipengyuania lutimaris]
MLAELDRASILGEDHAALAAAGEPGVGLCTVVGIDGSFSRRLGAQLAVSPDGSTIGSLSDGCLEAQLASDMRELQRPSVVRYGHGSPKIDFRLPCGGGLDILLDPMPDRSACAEATAALARREPARLALPAVSPLAERHYIPALRIVAFGEGPELEALVRLASAMGTELDSFDKQRLTLGQAASECRFDCWTAALLLFHDHEWELPLLEQALSSEAFYVGAQGGENARIARALALGGRGVAEEDIARVRSPVGLIPACKTPTSLALSALAEVVGQYERMHAGA